MKLEIFHRMKDRADSATGMAHSLNIIARDLDANPSQGGGKMWSRTKPNLPKPPKPCNGKAEPDPCATKEKRHGHSDSQRH